MWDLLECVFEVIFNVVFEFLFYTTEPLAGWRFYLPIVVSIAGICTVEWLTSKSAARLGFEVPLVVAGLFIGVVWEAKSG